MALTVAKPARYRERYTEKPDGFWTRSTLHLAWISYASHRAIGWKSCEAIWRITGAFGLTTNGVLFSVGRTKTPWMSKLRIIIR